MNEFFNDIENDLINRRNQLLELSNIDQYTLIMTALKSTRNWICIVGEIVSDDQKIDSEIINVHKNDLDNLQYSQNRSIQVKWEQIPENLDQKQTIQTLFDTLINILNQRRGFLQDLLAKTENKFFVPKHAGLLKYYIANLCSLVKQDGTDEVLQIENAFANKGKVLRVGWKMKKNFEIDQDATTKVIHKVTLYKNQSKEELKEEKDEKENKEEENLILFSVETDRTFTEIESKDCPSVKFEIEVISGLQLPNDTVTWGVPYPRFSVCMPWKWDETDRITANGLTVTGAQQTLLRPCLVGGYHEVKFLLKAIPSNGNLEIGWYQHDDLEGPANIGSYAGDSSNISGFGLWHFHHISNSGQFGVTCNLINGDQFQFNRPNEVITCIADESTSTMTYYLNDERRAEWTGIKFPLTFSVYLGEGADGSLEIIE